MTSPEVQHTPSVPPRPSRSSTKDSSGPESPAVPPRPIHRRLERSNSPNPNRFAQSPLNGGITPRASSSSLVHAFGNNGGDDGSDLIDLSVSHSHSHSHSHQMPSVGEEGMEYSVVAEEMEKEMQKEIQAQMEKELEASPEQTRIVGDDVKLHAPKPSLPAESAKRRVMAVTRTNSDKAATFGFGKAGYPGPDDRAASRDSLRRRPSTNFSTTSEQAHLPDDEHGIPEIGQRVPMNPYLGDVQAPSPTLNNAEGNGTNMNHHSRRHSARGLPPGSYGMHGHGTTSQDELDKAYYKKHPEMLAREQQTPLHDRQNDFAMSSADLNNLVRSTASRAAHRAGSVDYLATPADEVAFRASEEYAKRSSAEQATTEEAAAADQDPAPRGRRKTIHIEDPKHPEYYQYGADAESPVDNEGAEYDAPILASDEVDKEPERRAQQPVVRPRLDRNDSSYSQDGRSSSRPSSRPTSTYNVPPAFDHTRLEDVEEYEPLFPDEAPNKNENEQEKPVERKSRNHFPSKDVWEDAPPSHLDTAEVSTPDVTAEEPSSSKRHSLGWEGRPITPAHAFALQQEQLAEREAGSRKHYPLPPVDDKPRQPQSSSNPKSENGRRFPSKDVWEDAPESSLYEAEVSDSKGHGNPKPGVPARPLKKTGELLRPPLPERPSSAVGMREDHGRGPTTPTTPSVPPRPTRKTSSDAKGEEASRPPKPAVLSGRPVGGRIAALQAGFMNDLNKRLSQGPVAAKKEEPASEGVEEQKEVVPLTDARKSRARGPQRRAPTRAPAKASTEEAGPAVLSVSLPRTIWSIDPEGGELVFAEEALTKAESLVETSTEKGLVREDEAERDVKHAEQLSESEAVLVAQVDGSPEVEQLDGSSKVQSREPDLSERHEPEVAEAEGVKEVEVVESSETEESRQIPESKEPEQPLESAETVATKQAEETEQTKDAEASDSGDESESSDESAEEETPHAQASEVDVAKSEPAAEEPKIKPSEEEAKEAEEPEELEEFEDSEEFHEAEDDEDFREAKSHGVEARDRGVEESEQPKSHDGSEQVKSVDGPELKSVDEDELGVDGPDGPDEPSTVDGSAGSNPLGDEQSEESEDLEARPRDGGEGGDGDGDAEPDVGAKSAAEGAVEGTAKEAIAAGAQKGVHGVHGVHEGIQEGAQKGSQEGKEAAQGSQERAPPGVHELDEGERSHAGREGAAARDEFHADAAEEEAREEPAHGVEGLDARADEASGDDGGSKAV